MTERPSAGLRPDIQALRAIAVIAVFAFHLWPQALPGGFSGVDVFFVISGFLITGGLIREAEHTGRINVWKFWARRARRLLPAALTVLVASAFAVYAFLPENLWPQFLRESIAATLYVQNWLLASTSIDYFAARDLPSPAQHFWTLSAEEQFYIATPLLLIGVLALARRARWRRCALLAGIATITLASFAYSVWLTSVSAPTAYFVTPTRAWEFGIGALVVFAPAPRAAGAARLAVGAGIVGILSAALFLSNRVPFPGAIAAWPVVATAAVVWGGTDMGRRLEAIAGLGPVQYVGRVSYSIYLWHWPLIVILPWALDRSLTDFDKIGIIVATLLLAGLSTRFIENPIRYSTRRFGAGSPRTTVKWAAGAMACTIAIAGAGLLAVETDRMASVRLTATLEAESPDCLGAMALRNAGTCRDALPPDVLVPDPAHAGGDIWNRADCWTGAAAAELRMCTFGPEDAAVRLAAIGDSHSNAFLVAYEAIARRNGWRIDVAGHNGCYWTTGVQVKATQAQLDGCEGWKVELNAYLDRTAPYDAILVTHATNGAQLMVPAGTDLADATADGLLEAWSRQTARGSRIIAIRDNPAMAPDVVSCVTRYRELAVERCSRPVEEALGEPGALVEAARRSVDARLVDLTDIYCPDSVCTPIIGNVVVYEDRDHLTATFVKSLAPALADRIAAALR